MTTPLQLCSAQTNARVHPSVLVPSTALRLVMGRNRGVVVLSVSGEVDAFNSVQLGRTLAGMPHHREPVVVDFRALRFCSVAGVSVLSHLHEQFRSKNAVWAVVPGPWLTRVLQAVPARVLLPLCPDIDDAIRLVRLRSEQKSASVRD
ncbi:MAG: STAS domain-containing protein [Mycobacterium sp.]|nr:STAS domain-containing protein [Mycobacterium sp.]